MSSSDDTNFSVGYGKPPKAHRFKAGQSGNPRGRPKSLPELSDLVGKELKRKRVIVEDGERVSLPMAEILVKRLIDLAVKGRLPALMHTFALADQHAEKQRNASTQSQYTPITSDMSATEAARIYAEMINGAPSRSRVKK